MTEEERKADPLLDRALSAAADYDDADTDQRGMKRARVLVYGLAMVVEQWVRDALWQGAILFSVIVALFGVLDTESPAWRFGLVVAGGAGAVLVFVVLRSRWSWQWQYSVPTVVLGADALLLVLWNQR
ncbi:hypothetical protein [Nocardia higoensis]|uniref:hypothetical protein n=1 Tax=Nocardia higoensis TaxID=228599 RepID=UPI0002F59154|nr:hypothetical protein [Nocardia higoensis]